MIVENLRNLTASCIRIGVFITVFSLAFLYKGTSPVLAEQSPIGCSGSGLGISLFSSHSSAYIGDTIDFSVIVFNSSSIGEVVCDASEITANLVTPDGVNHPIPLVRTTLTDGQSDTYTNIVSYVVRAEDVQPNGSLAVTAYDSGTIHQNVVNSEGGANQGLEIYVLDAPVVPEFGILTASITGLSSLGLFLATKSKLLR